MAFASYGDLKGSSGGQIFSTGTKRTATYDNLRTLSSPYLDQIMRQLTEEDKKKKKEDNLRKLNEETAKYLKEYVSTQEEGWTGLLNRGLNAFGIGTTLPELVNEDIEYKEMREASEAQTAINLATPAELTIARTIKSAAETMTFGAASLFGDAVQALDYQLRGKRDIESMNEEALKRKEQLIKDVFKRKEIDDEKRVQLIKSIEDASKMISASDVYNFAEKSKLQVAGEAIGAFADAITFGMASAGLKTALAKGGVVPFVEFLISKEGTKFIAEQAVKGAAQFGLGGAGEALAEGETGIDVAKSAGTSALVGGVAQPAFAIGGASIGKFFQKVGLSRTAKKLLGKTTNEELTQFQQLLESGISEQSAAADILARRRTIPSPRVKERAKAAKISRDIDAAATRIEKDVKGITEEITGVDDITFKSQAKKAAKQLIEDEAKAIDMALGRVAPPEGVLPESMLIAVKNMAEKRGDIELLRQLAREGVAPGTKRLAQRFGILRELKPDDPLSGISAVVEGRAPRISKKSTKKELSKLNSKVEKAAPTKGEWAKFIDEIKC